MANTKEDLHKELAITIFCLQRPYKGNLIRYVSTESHDIYYIANPSLFLLYISRLLQRHTSNSQQVTVVLVNIDLTVTLKMFNFISNSLDHSKSSENVQTSENMDKMKSEVQMLGELSKSRDTFLKISGVRLHVINDCSFENQKSIFSAKMVALQQILRFLCLRHGASFSASSNLEHILNDPSSALNLFALLGDETAQPVFDFIDDKNDSVSVHQKIPLGWDTVHKILLVAKSAPHLSPGTCFREEVELEEFENALLELYTSFPENGQLIAKLSSYNLIEHENNNTLQVSPPTVTTYKDILNQLKNC